MLHFSLHWFTPVALVAAALPAFAQTRPTTPRPDPLDARTSVPAPTYVSVFEHHRLTGDDAPIPWREANDLTARIGGWRVYAREAQQGDSALAVKPTSGAPAPEPAKPPPQGRVGPKQP